MKIFNVIENSNDLLYFYLYDKTPIRKFAKLFFTEI